MRGSSQTTAQGATRHAAVVADALTIYAAPSTVTARPPWPVEDVEGLFALVDAPARQLFPRDVARKISRARVVRWGLR